MINRKSIEKRKLKGIKILKLRSWIRNKTLAGIEQEYLNNKNIRYNIEKAIGINGTTPVQCSSPYCCGNQRRIKGTNNLTIQELKAPTIKEFYY